MLCSPPHWSVILLNYFPWPLSTRMANAVSPIGKGGWWKCLHTWSHLVSRDHFAHLFCHLVQGSTEVTSMFLSCIPNSWCSHLRGTWFVHPMYSRGLLLRCGNRECVRQYLNSLFLMHQFLVTLYRDLAAVFRRNKFVSLVFRERYGRFNLQRNWRAQNDFYLLTQLFRSDCNDTYN